MKQSMLEKMLKVLNSDNDADVLMAFRALKGHFAAEGLCLDQALRFALLHKDQLKAEISDVVDSTAVAKKETGPAITGMPQCHTVRPDCFEIVAPAGESKELVQLQGKAAQETALIAAHLKDALVAAVINKSRLKLKVTDIKNSKGEVIEIALQAEYERAGMTPIRIWVNDTKGEVAALATVLRRAVANNMPDLMG